MPDFIEYNSLAAGPGIALGTAVTVANSDDNGTDPLDFALPSAAGATGTYATLPWTIGGVSQVGAVLNVTSATEANAYLRWDHKTANTERRGVAVFPIWLDAARPTTSGTPQIPLCAIRNTAGQGMAGLKIDDNANANKLVGSVGTGGVDLPALESTTVLQPLHLYWAGVEVTNDGTVGWILWDSDRTTVLEQKQATAQATGTVSPGEYRLGTSASAAVPRKHYLQHVQAGELATGWPAKPFTTAPATLVTSSPLAGRRIIPGGTGPFTLSSVTQLSGPTVADLSATGMDITFVESPTRTQPVVVGFTVNAPAGNTTSQVTIAPPVGNPTAPGVIVRMYCDGTSWS